MHNTPTENLEFRIQFAQTNLAWLLGEDTPNKEKVERCKKQIQDAKDELTKLKSAKL